MIVVDASVAVKWLVHEASSDLADDLLQNHSGDLIAPAIFAIEVAAALVRKANEVKANRAGSEAGLASLATILDNGIVAMRQLETTDLTSASALALDLGHPLKDCIYLALAMEQGCELVTCDARFAAKAKGAWEKVRVLEE
jgi:predicted nucleic acid-binding protein